MCRNPFFITIIFLFFCAIGHSQRLAIVSIDSLIISSNLSEDLNDYCALQEDSLRNHVLYLIDSLQKKYVFVQQRIERCYYPSTNWQDSIIQDLKNFHLFVLNEEDRMIRKWDFLHICSQKTIATQVGLILAEEEAFDEIEIAITDMPIYTDSRRPSPFITDLLVPFINKRENQILIDWALCQEEANHVRGKVPRDILGNF